MKRSTLGVSLLLIGLMCEASFAQEGRIALAAKARPASELAQQYRVILANGDVLIRSTIRIANDKLQGEGVEQIPQVDLKYVAHIRLIDSGAAWRTEQGETPLADTVRLKNGDELSGLVASADAQTLKLTDATGATQQVQTASISQISFAPTGNSNDSKGTHVILFDDGTTLSASSLSISPDRKNIEFVWTADGIKRSVQTMQVVSVYDLGVATPLTLLAPVESSGEAFVRSNDRDLSKPLIQTIRMDVRGVEVESRKFENALALKPRSRVTFDAGANAKRFLATLWFGQAASVGTCVVRIKSGDVVLSEIAQTPGLIAIDVDLKDAKQLTIEVDFAENYGIQSQAMLLDPRITR
jgi:hypothetical protein